MFVGRIVIVMAVVVGVAATVVADVVEGLRCYANSSQETAHACNHKRSTCRKNTAEYSPR